MKVTEFKINQVHFRTPGMIIQKLEKYYLEVLFDSRKILTIFILRFSAGRVIGKKSNKKLFTPPNSLKII